jgi:ribosomal-protein-alanine N-acetyltransferase
MVEYETNNKQHLSQWEPLRSTNYFSETETEIRVLNNYLNFQSGNSLHLVGRLKGSKSIVCVCSFTNIVHGVFQACNLGYSIDEQYQGKGLMFDMLQTSIEYVFAELDLHRIMANFISSNIRSEKLLKRLEFEQEGLAKSYLKIADSWQDHVLTSKINPSHVCI